MHSRIMAGKRPKNNPGDVHPKSNAHPGWIDFGNGKRYYMLSTWERNVARYFEFLKNQKNIKEWEYEPQRFFFEKISFGHRTYLPDFRITNNDSYQYYIEVKGWMDAASKTKLRRMKKYFPNIEIQIIDKDRYYAISKISPIIKSWE